jgi:tetratricopeptide (TPR) repeat protein
MKRSCTWVALWMALVPSAMASGWEVSHLTMEGLPVDEAPVEQLLPGAAAGRERPIKRGETLEDGTQLRIRRDIEVGLRSAGGELVTKRAGFPGDLTLSSSGHQQAVRVDGGWFSFKRVGAVLAGSASPTNVRVQSTTLSPTGTEFTVKVEPVRADASALQLRVQVTEGRVEIRDDLKVSVGTGGATQRLETQTPRRLLVAGDPELTLTLQPSTYLLEFGTYQDAVATFEAQAQQAQAANDNARQIDTLLALGDILMRVGQPAEALTRFERGVALAGGPEDAYWKAVLLGRRGYALQALNRLDAAAQALLDSMALHATLPQRAGERPLLEHSTDLAVTFLARGTYRCAEAWSIRLLRQLDALQEGTVHHVRVPLLDIRGAVAAGRGTAAWARGDAATERTEFAAALDWHDKVLTLQKQVNGIFSQGAPDLVPALVAIGGDEAALHRFADAKSHLAQAADIAGRLFPGPHVFKADVHLARAALLQGQNATASAMAEVAQALAVLAQIPVEPDRVRLGDALMLRADLWPRSEPAKAVADYRAARSAWQTVWPDESHPRFALLLPALARVLRASAAPPAEVQAADDAARRGAEALEAHERACPL